MLRVTVFSLMVGMTSISHSRSQHFAIGHRLVKFIYTDFYIVINVQVILISQINK